MMFQGSQTRAIAACFNAHAVGVGPEHLLVVSESTPLSGTISLIERLGGSTIIHVRLADGSTAVAGMQGQYENRLGAPISLAPSEQHVHRFDRNGQSRKKAVV
jgi:multiple sugar transport system ATP-binding protein